MVGCPNCGSRHELDVEIQVWARLDQDGTECKTDTDGEDCQAHHFTGGSRAQCNACGWYGIVAELAGRFDP